MKISIVTTTKSNIKNVLRLCKSLYPNYKNIHEFILVDAGTPNLDDSSSYLLEFPKIIDGKGTTRGEGKNIGIKNATGNVIVFLDDDIKVDLFWLVELKKSLKHSDIVAGYSPNPLGKDLARVPIYIKGQDVTYPTCNIAYKKEVFNKIGFFDKKLVTAEDVDFNCRCVKKGYTISYNPKMVAFHYHRISFRGFAKQAFWNGYGRKQFNRLHPELKKEHQHGFKTKNILRLGFGFLGYTLGDLFNGNRDT